MNTVGEIYAADLSGAEWKTSSYTGNNGNCVEIAQIPGSTAVAVRDTKNRQIAAVRASGAAFQLFTCAAADGLLQAA
ncbi:MULTISPECIES: DUF397 domain-containing protein [Streptacidiphilus]|uniref:DUF397 domain-containing protein n=1 Tax=Streptacidiphilus cavernicola TaxID=3342716 RepID=A0ABV6UP21_9ACTN|nr:DUF397 domain-containing protein [Streptacidiphilus jeojiense]